MPARNLCLFVHLQIRTYKRGCVLLCRNASVRHRNNFLSTHSYYLQTFQIGISTDIHQHKDSSRPYCFILANENGLWFNCAMYRSIISVFLCKPNLSLIFLRWLSTVWREIHSLSAIFAGVITTAPTLTVGETLESAANVKCNGNVHGYNLLTPVTIAFAATASEEETPSVAVANSKK